MTPEPIIHTIQRISGIDGQVALMPDNSQDLKPKDLVYILAIAGRIDAQLRLVAEKLDQNGLIYYGHAVCDSLNSSYSMFKYFFDLYFGSNDSDLMHEVMMSPEAIIAITVESLFLISFSVLATLFEKEKKDSFKKFIATAWPYFRDVIKALKNAYKGWRVTIIAAVLIFGWNINFLILPVGIVLGILSAINRFMLRKMLEDRKVMMANNVDILQKIKQLQTIKHHEVAFYLQKIKYQSLAVRRWAFVAVAMGGLLDGLYLYMGVLTLAVLAPSMFVAMATICSFYTAACVVTRIYEEYEFQLSLLITQTKCKLLLTSKELETLYERLLLLKNKQDKTREDLIALRSLEKDFCQLTDQFEAERKILKKQLSRTYFTAALLGLKNGLYAYSALTSIMFLAGAIFILCGAAFPPALLISSVFIGLVFIIGFSLHSLIANYQHLKKQHNDDSTYLKLIAMRNDIEKGTDNYLDKDTFQNSVKEGLTFIPLLQFFLQPRFEVLRSLFAGFGKGQKFTSFAGNPLQEMDAQGHYHDTPIMYILAVINAVIFGIIFALRALAKGLGRLPLGQVDLVSEDKTKLANPKATATPSNKPNENQQANTASCQPASSSLSHFGLFENKSRVARTPSSTPTNDARVMPVMGNTALGLA